MSERLCRKLRMFHQEGDVLYPVRMQDNDTGRLAFRLSRSGNTKADSIEVTDEQEMLYKVTRQGYKVRARTEKPKRQGGRDGLYALGELAIPDWQLIDNQENNA